MNRRTFLGLTLTAIGVKFGPRPSKWAMPALPAVPTGHILAYASPRLPRGWLVCDGRAVRRRDYPALAKLIGRAYGGNAETFRVPDLRASPRGLPSRSNWLIKAQDATNS